MISDTSPVRALGWLGHLDLLHVLFERVLVPPTVHEELTKTHRRFHPLLLNEFPFIEVRSPRDEERVRRLLATVHRGEAEALVLASEMKADLVLIDEAAGRQAARELGLVPMGVLGVLLLAKQRVKGAGTSHPPARNGAWILSLAGGP